MAPGRSVLAQMGAMVGTVIEIVKFGRKLLNLHGFRLVFSPILIDFRNDYDHFDQFSAVFLVKIASKLATRHSFSKTT